MQIGYLGPTGTFSEEAVLKYTELEQIKNPTFIPFTSFFAVGKAVLEQKVDMGILPIENSLEGQVSSANDILIAEDKLFAFGEVILPIRIHLVGKFGVALEQCHRIYSHPQPFGQCAEFLRTHFPTHQQITSASTSQAVADMLASPEPALALSNERAALHYGAVILSQNVQDNSTNETRFLVIGLTDHSPTGKDKTNICFTLPFDQSGVLYKVLQPFANARINLTRIESRPTKRGLGKYVFVLDLEGHHSDGAVANALEQLELMADTFRIIGSYPAWSS
jgi:prephenate dehydratase